MAEYFEYLVYAAIAYGVYMTATVIWDQWRLEARFRHFQTPHLRSRVSAGSSGGDPTRGDSTAAAS